MAAGFPSSSRTTVRPGLLIPRQSCSAWTGLLFRRKHNHAPWTKPALGLGPLRCFRRRTCQQAFIHATHTVAPWEALNPPATQCCLTQPNTGESAAFTIIAQSFPRWHRTQQLNFGASCGLQGFQERLKRETRSPGGLQGAAFAARRRSSGRKILPHMENPGVSAIPNSSNAISYFPAR